MVVHFSSKLSHLAQSFRPQQHFNSIRNAFPSTSGTASSTTSNVFGQASSSVGTGASGASQAAGTASGGTAGGAGGAKWSAGSQGPSWGFQSHDRLVAQAQAANQDSNSRLTDEDDDSAVGFRRSTFLRSRSMYSTRLDQLHSQPFPVSTSSTSLDRTTLLSQEEAGLSKVRLSSSEMQVVYKSAFNTGRKSVEMAQMELEADEMDFGPPTDVVSSGRRASVSRPMISSPLLAIPPKILGASSRPSDARALHTSSSKFPSSTPPTADAPRVRRSSTSSVESPVSTPESLSGSSLLPASTVAPLVDISTKPRQTPHTSRPRHSEPSDPASRHLAAQQMPETIANLIKAKTSGNYGAVQEAVRRYRAVESNFSIEGHNYAMSALLATRYPDDPIDSIVALYTEVFDHERLHPTGETYANIIQAFLARDHEVGRSIKLIEKRTLKKRLAGDARGPWQYDADEDVQLEQEKIDLARLQTEDYFSPALAIFQALGPKADDLPYSTLNLLISAAAKKGRVDLALSLFGRVEATRRPIPGNYVALVSMYGQEKDKEGVMDVFEAYLEARAKKVLILPSKTPTSAARRFDRSSTRHRHSTAAQWSPTTSSRNPLTDSTMWARTIESLFLCGDDVGAIALVERIQSAQEAAKALGKSPTPGYPQESLGPDIFACIINGFSGANDPDSARVWFDQALTLFEPRSDSSGLNAPWFYGILFRALDHRSIDFANHIFRTMFTFIPADIAPTTTVLDANLVAAYAATEEATRNKYLDMIVETKTTFHEAVAQNRSVQRNITLGTGVLFRIIRALIYFDRFDQVPAQFTDLCKGVVNGIKEAGMRTPARWIQLLFEYQATALGVADPNQGKSSPRHQLLASLKSRPSLAVALDVFAATSSVVSKSSTAPDVRVSALIVSLYAEARAKADAEPLNLTGTQWFYTVYAHAAVAGAISSGYQASQSFPGVEPVVEDLVASKVKLPKPESLDYHGLVVQLKKAKMEKKRVIAVLSHLDQTIADGLAHKGEISPPVQLETPPQSPRVAPVLESTQPIDPADALATSRSPESLPTPPATPPTYISDASPAPFLQVPAQQIDPNLNSTAGRLIHQANSEAALALLVANAHKGLFAHPDTVGHLVELLGREGKVDAARQAYLIAYAALAPMAPDPEAQSISWVLLEDHMIIALAQAGALSEVTVHRERLLAAGSAPSADGYAAMILNMNETTDDASVALELFDESQRFNVTPNVYLFNTLISKLSRARRAKDAIDYFELMKNCGLRPSSITYGAIINACCKTGDGSTADYLFEEMVRSPGFKPRVPPYNTMIQFYTQTQPNRERALYFYNELIKAGIRPTGHTYKLLLDVYGSVGEPDPSSMSDVFELLVVDPQVTVTGAHWASLINAWGCVGKDLDRAVSIFDSIATHPSTKASGAPLPDAVVYESLLNAFLANQRPDLCEKYLEQMKVKGVRMTAYVANTLIKGHASQNNMEAARNVFESLTDPPSGVAAAGNHTIDRHPRHQQGNTPLSPDAPIYREPSTWEIMVRSEIAAGEPKRAGELMKRIEQRAFPEAVVERIRKHLTDSGMGDLIASSESTPSS